MPGIRETRRLPYSAEQMFDLVADIEAYPEFLPWVIATRIRKRDEHGLLADMVVGFKALRERFSSRVVLARPNRIRVDYVDGPLRDLENVWMFEPLDEGGCKIDFSVEFEFRNRVFQSIAGRYFDRAFRQMMAAFERRAETLYGSSSSSAHAVA